MTIAVISMIRDVWGGSEELWYQMAKEALRGGHKVIHLAFEHPGQHPKVQELEKMGLMRIVRPGWVPATSGKKKGSLLRNQLYPKTDTTTDLKTFFS